MLYVGITPSGDYKALRTSKEPTPETTGNRFPVVIGPFRTVRGTKVMALYGRGNPHLQCVDDAERHAKHSKRNVEPQYGEIPAELPDCPIIKI